MNTVIAFPNFAPLSSPMVFHLLGTQREKFTHDVRQNTARFRQRFHELETHVAQARKRVLTALNAAYHTDPNIEVRWFCERLPALRVENNQSSDSESDPPQALSLQTIHNWRKSNVFHFHGWGDMDLDSAAAIMIAALCDPRERERHFIPTWVEPDEPRWWCLSQAPPENGRPSPIIPLPIPLPRNLKFGTLVWSGVWPSFESEWSRDPQGAIRFVGINQHILELWDPMSKTDRLNAAFQENPEDQQFLRKVAQSTLLKLSVGRLGVPANLPLLWNGEQIWPQEVLAYHFS